MGKPKTIYCTVTNDLTFDQRMQRICGSLSRNGYNVVLVGRKMTGSIPLKPQSFKQKRLSVGFQKGKAFYIAYNICLFFYLFFKKIDVVCAIDLDSIIPCLWISKIKGIPRVYDAHELFTEMKEIVERPKIHRFWLEIEKYAVPQFKIGYTVNLFIAEELERRYGVKYGIVRNLPSAISQPKSSDDFPYKLPEGKFFLYQGAVNEGRSFETLIPAMVHVSAPLVIAGDGNFMGEVKRLIVQYQLQNQVICLGAVPPAMLKQLTPKAYYGLTLFESTGLNQYYSLANRFFDYIQGGIPQLCVDYPEYAAINKKYNIAYPISNLSPRSLFTTLNKLLTDDVIYASLQFNCITAAKDLCWEKEEENLNKIYAAFL